jgi:outer membrane protein assembly factor BamB
MLPSPCTLSYLVRSTALRCVAAAACIVPVAAQDGPRGWLNWRGPSQSGAATETGLFDVPQLEGEGKNLLWTYPAHGRGTPVIADGRVFGCGYVGEGKTIEEVLFCLDEATGKELWVHHYPDFLSDVVYQRYAIGSPTIDPETGNVFAMTVPGLLHAFTRDGELLWQRSLMEDFGRLTFPNGRNGAPLVLDDLVIMHFIFASWGPLGPARDRFYAFDKHTGEAVWVAVAGENPYDNSLAMPVIEERGGRTVMYTGLGCGNMSAIDARTGEVLWRFLGARGGYNSSALLDGDRLIAVHGLENIDSSVIGRMVALDLTKPAKDGVLPADAEVWRRDLIAFSSSPALADGRVYISTQNGDLHCLDPQTGEDFWHIKLGSSQIHASPLVADGKVYVPLPDGEFYVVRAGGDTAEVLGHVKLEGDCLGQPSVSGGRMYVHTTSKLYCFGEPTGEAPVWPRAVAAKGSEPVKLQLVPGDDTVRVGDPVTLELRRLDSAGRVVAIASEGEVTYAPCPLLRKGEDGRWVAAKPGTAVLKADAFGLSTTARLRVVPELPLKQDFDALALDQEEGKFAFPPGEWLGGRVKWQVLDLDGQRVVARNMSNPLFQRTITHLGDPRESDYTMRVDVMTDGTRRNMSAVGVVHQRYLIILKGNHQELEVSSNMEHVREVAPFAIKPKTWYTLLTRVVIEADGTALVRAKAWPKGEAEPEQWTIEVRDPNGHTHGAPGLYGFTPQSRFTVYMDNLSVTRND